MSRGGARRPPGRRGLDTPWLAPAPPLTRREARWAAALLDDEAALRRFLRRGPRVAGERGGAVDDAGGGVANEHPLVAVVILSHNDRRMALRCLDGVDRLTYRKGALFVVLVENSSDPAQRLSAREIRARGYGYRVALLRPERNTGFAGGVNLAARYAFGRGRADHLLLLNDDAVIPAASVDLVQQLVAIAGLLPNVAAVGPKVYFARHPGGADVIASAGASFVDLPPEVGHRDRGLRGVVESDFVVGVCLLIPRHAWRLVGAFDDRYFAYYEETDWCYRARRRGLRSYCLRDVYVRHGDHAEEQRKRNRDPDCTRLMARNQVLLARRHPWFDAIVALRLVRKYRQLRELGERRGAAGMVEGLVLARRGRFPGRGGGRARLAIVPPRRRQASVPRPVLAFSMGRLTRHKGIDALARLAARCPAAIEVHVRGVSNLDLEDPDDARCLNRVCALLRDSGAFRRNAVTIYGGFDAAGREAFLRRYARRDAVLVHPARPEGFGLVLLEGMARGIPVVADERGGLARAVSVDRDPPMKVIDFAAVGWEGRLLRWLRRCVADRQALARRRRRSRAFAASQPSVGQLATAYRRHLLAACAERGVTPPAVVLLSGASLYKVGGCGEWLASLAPRLHRAGGLRVSLLTLPGGESAPVAGYRRALRRLPWEEVRIRAHADASASVGRAARHAVREIVRLFATEEPPTSRRYARTLCRFLRRVEARAYWSTWNHAAGELVGWYVQARPELSEAAARRGLALLLRGFLVENLLAGAIGGHACVYACDPATGLPAAVGRAAGTCAAYVLGMHAFTDLGYDQIVDGWRDLRGAERAHFKRVIRQLLAYSVCRADSIVCVSGALAEHVRRRFADYPLPPIETIPNTLLTG